MKILRVIPSMNPKMGGPCQGIRNSIPQLKEWGVVNEVVSMDSSNEDFLNGDPFVVHALGPSIGPWSYCYKLMEWLELNISRFQIVIIHGLWLYHSFAVNKVVQNLKKNKKKYPKVLIMPHGMLDPWFQRDKSRRLKALRNHIYWHFIEKRIVNEADGLLFTSKLELDLAEDTFPDYKPKRVINVGYGIPKPRSYDNIIKLPLPKNESYILFLGRLHAKKGVDLVITAYLNLIDEFLDFPALVIAGPLDSEYAQKMQKLASNCDKIIFTGMLINDLKWSAIYCCDAFILPSHQENFGISVVEALACGKPVLISNQVNIWKEIDHGGAGLIENDTLSGALNLMKRWFKMSFHEKKQMSQNASLLFNRKFTIEKHAKTLYETCINFL